MNETAYFLRTERLGFRRWAIEDLPLALSLWGSAEVGRYLGGAMAEAAVYARLIKEIETQEALGVQYWPIYEIGSGDHAGCAGFRPYGTEAGVLEMGVHLARSMWGRAMGEEAARGVMAYGFERLELTAIVAGHHPENRASERLLGRLGFRFMHEEPWGAAGVMHPFYRLERGGWVG